MISDLHLMHIRFVPVTTNIFNFLDDYGKIHHKTDRKKVGNRYVDALLGKRHPLSQLNFSFI